MYILLCLGLHFVVFALRIKLLQLNLEIRPTFKQWAFVLDFNRIVDSTLKSARLAIGNLRLVDPVELLALRRTLTIIFG